MGLIAQSFLECGVGSIANVTCATAFKDGEPNSAGEEMHNAAQALIRMSPHPRADSLRRLLACAMLNCDADFTKRIYFVTADGTVKEDVMEHDWQLELIKRLCQ